MSRTRMPANYVQHAGNVCSHIMVFYHVSMYVNQHARHLVGPLHQLSGPTLQTARRRISHRECRPRPFFAQSAAPSTQEQAWRWKTGALRQEGPEMPLPGSRNLVPGAQISLPEVEIRRPGVVGTWNTVSWIAKRGPGSSNLAGQGPWSPALDHKQPTSLTALA